MPFPESAVVDDFNRADEGPPPSADWTTTIFGGDLFSITGRSGAASAGLSVVSNEVAPAGNADGYLNTADVGPDLDVYVNVAGAALHDLVALYGRLTTIGSGTTDGYGVVFHQAQLSPSVISEFDTFRIDNSVVTQLGSSLSIASVPAGIGLRILGDAISVYVNVGAWADIKVVSDATYTSEGKVGLLLRDDGAGTLRGDDFGAGGLENLGSDRTGGNVTVGP